ncbi:LytR/AlgR family response regulator transcription factor [Clostridium sp. Marseille-P299]|uniref:LytR/AlgR family response regulator transcription factor n=1 Tax=Clostridium sp. Marseille-P299 TaxID=1805477 RepID=UPI00082C0D0B|nr:LytTR family DNA-binding domain-containing protein [Clostridium sp. Marseille-P299]
MFRVAICDDEQAICSQIENIILNFQKEVFDKIDVEVFYSGEELCRFILNEHKFDVIFLDIELKQMNGVDLGRRIREEMHDEVTQLIYISAKQSYAMDLFQTRPLNFLIKPICKEKISKTLKLAMQLSSRCNLFFEFHVGKIYYRVPYKEIIYFESDDKKIRIISIDKTYEFYGKLADIKKGVPNKDFLLIHKSYLINYMYVSESQYDSIKFTNGVHLPISQTYRKEVRDFLIKRRKGGE